jgi:hypothetical protein
MWARKFALNPSLIFVFITTEESNNDAEPTVD